MSYLVLARKYRPKNFSEMVGQEHVVQALGNALTTQRLHHAYLFTGTRGVGKTTVSRILAKSLNCTGLDGRSGITAHPCGVCSACTDIDSGRFVDYTELDAASNRGVDEVQSLLEQAVYKPVQGRFKVFMIDEVHMLTNTAFNAMLKTLEEPPEYLKFVLATTDPQKVPVTVLSRCLQFNLRPMAPETVLEHLTKVLALEVVPADEPSLRLLARAARGSMRDALSLTDQAIAFGSGTIDEAKVRLMLGSVDRSYVFRLIEALALGDGKTVVETIQALRLNGLSAASTLEEMSSILQRMAVLQAVPGVAASSSDSADPDAADTARIATLMPADETHLLYSLCLHGRGELGLAPDEYAALTMVLLRLLAFKPAHAASSAEKKTLKSGAEVAAAVSVPVLPVPALVRPPAPLPAVAAVAAVATPVMSVLAVRTPPAPAQATAEETPPWEDIPAVAPTNTVHEAHKVIAIPVRHTRETDPASAEERLDVANTGDGAPALPTEPPGESLDDDFWYATVQTLLAQEAVTAMARELALQSQLIARDTDQWQLRVERAALNHAGSRDRLQAALAAAGHAVRLNIEVGRVSDCPAKRNAVVSEEKQRVAEEIVRSDPFVQAMVRDFGAKIVPGSLKQLTS
jgi:DNA polymerase III subunit gamma/tau